MPAMDSIAGRVGQMDAQPSPLPAEVRDIFAREQADLAAAGMPDGIARAGTVLPDSDLLDVTPALLDHLPADVRESVSSARRHDQCFGRHR
jgi:hypothetical protein